MRAMRSMLAGAAGASLVIAAFAAGAVQPKMAAVPGEVHFTASGDFDARTETSAVLNQIGAIDPDLHLALGDLSYGVTGQESTWCDFVTTRVGAGFPFELISGNHESNGQNGNINDFSACLPNQVPGAVGTYGREYFVDVPADAPLVRFIAISPGLTFPGGSWSYASGTPHYQWTVNAIDQARSAGIPWVVVGMHMPCLSVGEYACASGVDINNLMMSKRVDLVLNGHEHLYARTKQLATGPNCSGLTPGSYTAGCVVDADSTLVRGAGTVFATVGTGGVALRDVSTTDAEAPYFAATSGANQNPSWGNLEVVANADSLTANFRRATGGTYTDAFTIGAAAANTPPTASFTASCTNRDCTVDASGSTDGDGTITGYAWDFGDSTTGTGNPAARSYAAAGNYTITLTVTDNAGGTNTTTRPVTATDPPGPVALAADTFGRTVASGWGTADSGGAWQLSGATSSFSVADGVGKFRLPTANGTLNAFLNGVSSTATDLSLTIASDKVPAGSGSYVWAYGRRISGGGAYLAKLNLRAGGDVRLSLVRTDSNGNAEVALTSTSTAGGVTYAAGEKLSMRVRVTGTSPSTIQAKVWKTSAAEPAAWQLTATDSTASIQAAGGIGLKSYLSSSVTNVPIVVSFDDLLAVTP
ncbi:3',5'-cyclic AMP phosphodiesterase CpdA [Microterricola gilva]|uniref:3',5'-cyclic AMP phosphodiesterase CpdA n=1 Tax=Microterricola gilva TaxID=393267 RepID=A0A4Q8AMZ6_9MICO|nr:PKD domain-containing protein [Microterricola gilva]RZU65325.1 3',5'-cyclic AMP phosphodiesterase CpdA [Microterricola gilva]